MKKLANQALSALSFATAGQCQDTPVLRFSAIPSQDMERNIKLFSPFATYLEESLGVHVRFLPAESYEAAVKTFGRGDVHLAWLGAWSGVQARALSPGAEAIAQGTEDANFKSYIIANAKAGLFRSTGFPQDIKGKSFTFGSPISTSGRLMPEYFIRAGLKKFGEGKYFLAHWVFRRSPSDVTGRSGWALRCRSD